MADTQLPASAFNGYCIPVVLNSAPSGNYTYKYTYAKIPGKPRRYPFPTSNPDIDGLVIAIAFIATGLLSSFFVALWYFVGCSLMADVTSDDFKVRSEKTNPIDLKIQRRMWAWLWAKRYHRRAQLTSACERITLALSDTQLVSGIAILVATWSQLDDGITIFHWSLAVQLAWFSSITHLGTLTILKEYFRRHRIQLSLRLTLMTVLVLLLMVSLVPEYLAADLRLPVRCWFQQLPTSLHMNDGINRDSTIITLVISEAFLAISFISKALKLSRNGLGKIGRIAQKKLESGIKKTLQKIHHRQGILWTIPYVFILANYYLLTTFFDFIQSTLFELLWILFAVIWGLFRHILERWVQNVQGNTFKDQKRMTFGQIMALCLFMLPLLSILEVLSSEVKHNQEPTSPITITLDEDKDSLDSLQPIRRSDTLLFLNRAVTYKIQESKWYNYLIFTFVIQSIWILCLFCIFSVYREERINQWALALFVEFVLIYCSLYVMSCSLCLSVRNKIRQRQHRTLTGEKPKRWAAWGDRLKCLVNLAVWLGVEIFITKYL
ncbi:MAG: hypothetical protein M1814_003746 [Vezdaea aestivalis]|nr:MAG: hypothetical protein M1814_003746 [Vezdaea aestivalis]